MESNSNNICRRNIPLREKKNPNFSELIYVSGDEPWRRDIITLLCRRRLTVDDLPLATQIWCLNTNRLIESRIYVQWNKNSSLSQQIGATTNRNIHLLYYMDINSVDLCALRMCCAIHRPFCYINQIQFIRHCEQYHCVCVSILCRCAVGCK